MGDIELIDFITYKVVGQERDLNNLIIDTVSTKRNPTKEDISEWLEYNFDKVIERCSVMLTNRNSFDNIMQETFETFKSSMGYELDGVVLSSPEVIYHEDAKSYIYDECAFKFAAESVEVKVTGITWNITRTQRLVPVVQFEPVFLSGAVLQNATGHNAKFILDNEIKIGSTIEICRSNEVIPYIKKVVD